jgi:tetratricopeptide (TPR) repeat protein
MRQNNFSAAISFLTQAQQNGYKDRAVEDALATSRFWYTMGEASQAFDANQFELAAEKYKAALAMRPKSEEALNGLAGLYVKQQQFAAAAGIYEQLLKVQPNSTEAWRGLFLAEARDGENQRALALTDRFPAPVKSALARDPEYLRTLATIYHAENRTGEAERVLAQALAMPFPAKGAGLKTDTRLQYAGILMEARRFDQAAELYRQILADDPGNRLAWMGLVSAHHELGQDNEAIADVQRMPPATYEASLTDPGFLSLLGAMYSQANQLEIAQGLLERAAKLQMANGGQPAISLQLQLAAIYLARNLTAQAYTIYRHVLEAHPDRVDAWKGLIGALQFTNRNTEAIEEIALIPPPVRKQLETDVEFLQGEASLYGATGDIPRALEVMRAVQAHYAQTKNQPPASVEIQNAWLLFNTKNDRALYPALMRLGARQDLTTAQREAIQDIWANWSVRRAGAAMDNGTLQRAVDILDAASQAFPDNMAVRKAVAGGYARVGRSKEAVAVFKTIPMQDASAGDFEAAIGAALGANDKAQAELWLRQALGRFSRSPGILAMAARFEQARGDNHRAADYWRASLAAMPQASPADRLAHELVYPDQDMKARRAVTAADLQRLLDPNEEPFPKTNKLPPLPSYGADPYNGRAPVDLSQPAPANQNPAQPPDQNQQSNPPAAGGVPPFNPQAARFVAQAPGQALFFRKVAYWPQQDKPANSGRVELPPWEQNIDSTAPVPLSNPPHPSAQTQAGLRISSQPMGELAARVQALFAEQTDSQLTQGSAANLRALPHAVSPKAGLPASTQYNMAQYTPSAQEAATGAYSPPRQNAAQQSAQPQSPAPAKPVKKQAQAKAAATPESQPPPPPLASAPVPPPQQPAEPPQPQPAQEPANSNTGLTDEELQQRNLPPLRGPWVRVQREQRTTSPREEAELQLRSIESGYSPWTGGAGLLNYRSGDLGYDHLSALEAPFEISTPLGYNARLTAVAKPVFLDSGQANGNSVITVLGAPSPGGQLTLITIPQPIGSDMNTSGAASTTTVGIPPQQNATGVGGELQLAFPHLALAGGYTPAGFLVATFTARAQWRPGNGPFTFSGSRDSLKDTQLSYAGLRDPAGNTLGNMGQIWGGVIANQGTAQYSRGNAESGFYIGAGGQYISGFTVETNSRIDGSGGAYWRLLTSPEYGNLSIGANFFGMHYAHNEDAFTLGMGGYFSPQAYFLANVPFTWAAHSGTRWHYNILGSFGVQAFQEDSTPLFPLVSTGLENTETVTVGSVTYSELALPAKTSVGPNYDLRAQAAYQIGPHWFAGGFFSANNSRNYSAVSTGFYVRFLFREQPSTVTAPTGLFPTDGLRPFTVP